MRFLSKGLFVYFILFSHLYHMAFLGLSPFPYLFILLSSSLRILSTDNTKIDILIFIRLMFITSNTMSPASDAGLEPVRAA